MSRTSAFLLFILGCSSAPTSPPELDRDVAAIRASKSGADVDKLTTALAEVHERLRAKPDSAEGHLFRANILAGAGCIDLALQSYSQALALKPGYVEALLARGALFAMY